MIGTLTMKVKELAHNVSDYVGIAPIDRFENAPEGHHPADLLPGAKSVISMGIRIPRGAQISAWTLKSVQLGYVSDIERVGMIYKRFGYNILNIDLLDSAALQVARLLEKEDHVAVPIMASGCETYEEGKPNMIEGPWGVISHRHAAVAAGIGELGWNGLVLNPDVGPRARYITVITDAGLEPDPMYAGRKLCEPEKCGFICAKVCPAQSLSSDESKEAFIGDREFRIGKMDHLRCIIYQRLLVMGHHGITDVEVPELERQLSIADFGRSKRKVTYSLWEEMAYGKYHNGGLCLLKCPIRMSRVVSDKILELSKGVSR